MCSLLNVPKSILGTACSPTSYPPNISALGYHLPHPRHSSTQHPFLQVRPGQWTRQRCRGCHHGGVATLRFPDHRHGQDPAGGRGQCECGADREGRPGGQLHSAPAAPPGHLPGLRAGSRFLMGRQQQVKRTQENCSATRLAVSGFTVVGLVSRLSLANLSDSEFFLVARASFSKDGFQQGEFWEVCRT